MINVIDIHCHQLVTKSNVSRKKRIKMQSMIKLLPGGSVNYVLNDWNAIIVNRFPFYLYLLVICVK